MKLAERHKFSVFDAPLVVAPALKAGCKVLYSGDIHDGQEIKGELQISNPFRGG